MVLVLTYVVISLFLELTLPYLPRQYVLTRSILGAFAIGILVALCIDFATNQFGVSHGLLILLNVYRIINLLRIMQSRMHPAYLHRTSLRTSCWLVSAQIVLLIATRIVENAAVSSHVIWLTLTLLQFVVAISVVVTIWRHVRRSSASNLKVYNARDLPSVTVAIAARNETESLNSCIKSLLASDYPKLEILVLDDCSQARRTPEIIRSFAHDGVRFVPGDEPGANWLARNQAYDTLARAASGSYLLYCSTSVRVEPDSIRKLVSYALDNRKTMLSVMPNYELNSISDRAQETNQPSYDSWSIIQSMRTAWELLPPRQWFSDSRPPVMNTCWLVKASALKTAGGFVAVSRMITPEEYFARKLSSSEAYDFLPDGARYGVSSQKTPAEQLSTAIRVSYPSLHRRPEVVAFTTLGLLIFGLLPFASSIFFLRSEDMAIVSVTGFVASALLLLAYRQVLLLTYGQASILRVCTFPVGIIVAVYLHHYSMYKYEFSEVLWKDRNICVPAMHVVPHLPSA